MGFAAEPVNAEASNGRRIQPDSCDSPEALPRPDAFRRLSPFGWNGGVLLNVALLAA
jgi:hypothetical protein